MIYEMYVDKHTCVQDIINALLDDHIMKQVDYKIKIYIPNETEPIEVYCKRAEKIPYRFDRSTIDFKKFHFEAAWNNDITEIGELIYMLAFPEFMTTFLLSRYVRCNIVVNPHVRAFLNMFLYSDPYDERCTSYLHQCFDNYDEFTHKNEYGSENYMARAIINTYDNVLMHMPFNKHRSVFECIKDQYEFRKIDSWYYPENDVSIVTHSHLIMNFEHTGSTFSNVFKRWTDGVSDISMNQ